MESPGSQRRSVREETDLTETFSRWDPAEQLGAPEDAWLYLWACSAEDPGDGSVIRAGIGDVVRAGMPRAAIRRLIEAADKDQVR